jgi:hypothetical protein
MLSWSMWNLKTGYLSRWWQTGQSDTKIYNWSKATARFYYNTHSFKLSCACQNFPIDWIRGHFLEGNGCSTTFIVQLRGRGLKRSGQTSLIGSSNVFPPFFFPFFSLTMINVSHSVCLSPQCNQPATLQCPTCLKLEIDGSFFCSQDCFKKNWVRSLSASHSFTSPSYSLAHHFLLSLGNSQSHTQSKVAK